MLARDPVAREGYFQLCVARRAKREQENVAVVGQNCTLSPCAASAMQVLALSEREVLVEKAQRVRMLQTP